MRKPLKTSRTLRIFLLFFLAGLSLLAGCGKLKSLVSRHKRVRGLVSRVQGIRDWFSRVPPEPNEPHSVTITWVAGKSPVAGYNVYREFQYGGPVKLTPQVIPGTQYTDTTVLRGRSYSYFVTSVDPKGLESVPSERVTVTVPIGATPPAKK